MNMKNVFQKLNVLQELMLRKQC